MDEKIKDQEALLVKDSKNENLKAISGTDEKGGLKTVSSTAEHEQSFLKFDKQCFGELSLQLHTAVQAPTQFHFFKVLFEGVVASARVLTEMLKAPDAPSNNASSG